MNVQDYLSLVPSQNQNKPKFMEWLRVNLSITKDIQDFIQSIIDTFSIASATGVQLDIIGQYVGISRVLPFVPLYGSRTLNDVDYRKIIRAKVAINAWDGTNETLPNLWATSFPELGFVVVDNQDMSMAVYITGRLDDFQAELINNGMLVPHPAGVKVTYIIPSQVEGDSISVQSGLYQTGINAYPEALRSD